MNIGHVFEDTFCPGCGCEPEINGYYRRNGERVGYWCSCGAIVIDGLMQGVEAS